MDKTTYEKLQRIQFIIMFSCGIALFIIGGLSLAQNWELSFQWAVSAGLGLIMYGGTGSYLTAPFHVRRVRRRAKTEEDAGAPAQKTFITKYITSPGGGVMTFVIFLLSMFFIAMGVIQLIHFFNTYVW